MKKMNMLLVLPTLLAVQSLCAQAHLTLSNEHPAAGEKVMLTYDPSGTPVDGKPGLKASVYFLDNKDYPVADIALKADGKVMKGDFTVNPAAKAFFVAFSADGTIDDNNAQGYFTMVYKDGKVVLGANAMKGYWLASGMGAALSKIKTDMPAAAYKAEADMYPATMKDYQSTYYVMLARSPANAEMVNTKIAELEQSSIEKDRILAASLLTAEKKPKVADSLNADTKVKFPNGTLVRNEMLTAFLKEKDVAKKESMFAEISQKFPENESDKTTSLDSYRLQLASAYITKGDMAGYEKYANSMHNKTGLENVLNSAAWALALKGENLADAEKMSRQSLDMLTAKINNPIGVAYQSPGMAKANSQTMYYEYAYTYALILFKENKMAEALKYEQDVVDHTKRLDGAINEDYALILAGNGQYAKAQEVAANSIKEGQSTDKLVAELKKDYIKIKGSDAGYDDYLASLQSAAKDKAKQALAKTMINQPAPLFALKDLSGKTVTLADLKGKVVIVDFWATWCGPCKASFPGMQLAVNKYKNDPNVQFLFVDCWETADNYIDGVKKFIADTKYTFNVLVDEKGDDGRQSKVVGSYGVTGIPTKFIIDKNGNIRFKYIGYAGTPEALVDEVSNMIDMAKNPTTVGQKVSMNN